MVHIGRYQGKWKASAGYPPYVALNQAKYGYHLFVIPKNDVHGRLGQVQTEAPGGIKYIGLSLG